jgi:hypothetical protein
VIPQAMPIRQCVVPLITVVKHGLQLRMTIRYWIDIVA